MRVDPPRAGEGTHPSLASAFNFHPSLKAENGVI